MSEALLRVRALEKEFVAPGGILRVLRGIDLDLGQGEIHVVLGASGVGKSTLLHIVGALDRPTRGGIEFRGEDLFRRSDADLARFRNRHVGFVFQFHHLLPEFTALENVMMPGLIGGASLAEGRSRARELLAQVGLSEREGHKPNALSGGEQQRVAVARALFREPLLVIADEPSGNLDPETAERLHALVYTLARERGQSWLIATHNESLARVADNRSRLIQGRLIPEDPGEGPGPVEAAERTQGA